LKLAGQPIEHECLLAAERWVRHPDDANRRACLPLSETAGLATPAGIIAIGVFYSGGSLAPPEYDPVPPKETLTGQMVMGALILAATREPKLAAARYATMLSLGRDVARGLSTWEESQSRV
jgi:hypothetical protein